MNSLQRYDDIPAPLKWILIAIKEVGFPIAVCVWLAWFTTVANKDMTKAIDRNTAVLKAIGHKMHVRVDDDD